MNDVTTASLQGEGDTAASPGGTVWDAPNQQVVRPDESGPGDEGGGDGTDVDGEPDQGLPEAEGGVTKAELLDRAREVGATPANAAMSKAELQAAIDRKLAEG